MGPASYDRDGNDVRVGGPLSRPAALGLPCLRSNGSLVRKDRTIAQLYDYWILGQSAVEREPRWSIMRNVLHWVD